MSSIIKVVASGMQAQQTRIETTAHNLANLNTPGFKASRVEFQDQEYTVRRFSTTVPGTDQVVTSEAWLGTGVTANGRTVFSQGSPVFTSIPTDVAIVGNGFFQVKLPDGTPAFTRNGAFMTDNQGRLVTSDGYQVDPPIQTQPGTLLRVTDEGLVQQVTANGDVVGAAGTLQVATFVNPEGLKPLGKGLFVATNASGPATLGAPGEGRGVLVAGAIEQSNVSVADEMVNMLEAQRAYGVAAKAVSAMIEMLDEANSLDRAG